jgi:hypothetical protein
MLNRQGGHAEQSHRKPRGACRAQRHGGCQDRCQPAQRAEAAEQAEVADDRALVEALDGIRAPCPLSGGERVRVLGDGPGRQAGDSLPGSVEHDEGPGPKASDAGSPARQAAHEREDRQTHEADEEQRADVNHLPPGHLVAKEVVHLSAAERVEQQQSGPSERRGDQERDRAARPCGLHGMSTSLICIGLVRSATNRGRSESACEWSAASTRHQSPCPPVRQLDATLR